jgi:hypothetical protein
LTLSTADPIAKLGLEELLADMVVALEQHDPSPKHRAWDPKNPCIAVDFDGVIHSYVSGWLGSTIIPDPPLPGAIEWLNKIVHEFKVVIFSARCNDPDAIQEMKAWMRRWGLSDFTIEKFIFEPGKPSCHVFIDDRAIRFTGNFWDLSAKNLRGFKPWYYDQEEWKRSKR